MLERARMRLAVVLVCAGTTGVLGFGPTMSPAAAATVAYEDDWEDVSNPGRGFFVQVEDLPGSIPDARAEGLTVVRGVFRLDEHRESDALPESYLEAVGSTFEQIQAKGLKIIPSFAYDFSKHGNDATLPRVLRHIEQLGAVLEEHKAVILYINAGFIGAWGEWHSSDNNLDRRTAKKAILDAQLQHFPRDRKIALRYPRDKRAILGDTALTRREAHTTARKARVGYSNDCFLADGTEGGTWQDWSGDLGQRERAYVAKETSFVPMGGETCLLDSIQPEYSNCDNAKARLEEQHWSVLNNGFYSGVLDMWRRDGCYDEIRQRLGYRFTLVDASLSETIVRGAPLNLTFRVRNDGYAAPYNERPVEVVLREHETGALTTLTTDADPRYWFASQTHTMSVDTAVPMDVPPGHYEVLLRLPDPAAELRDRAEYAIRLANRDVWEPETGLNALRLQSQVVPSVPQHAAESVADTIGDLLHRLGGGSRP